MGKNQSEWSRLGARLAELSPEKFAEILDALRETVDAHEILGISGWVIGATTEGPREPGEA